MSETFDAQVHAELNDAGEPASGQDEEAYTQVTRSGADDKVVYTVAGNGGKATVAVPSYPHPAHFYGNLTIGSVVVDLTDSRLEANFINENGEVLDYFVITR